LVRAVPYTIVTLCYASLNALEDNMVNIQPSVWVGDAIITAVVNAFRRDGTREAELSEILVTAGAPEPAFDEHFQSKEDLVSAYLKERHGIWMRWFETAIGAKYEATGGGLEIIADVLEEGFEDPKCFGCAFINIIANERSEFDNEPSPIAREQKEHLTRFIEQLAAGMGLQHPEVASSAAVLVIERTIVRTLMTGSLKEAETARLLFQCLQHA
jgi:AcrR family transcriptional regulator